jgi:hypothetical protein
MEHNIKSDSKPSQATHSVKSASQGGMKNAPRTPEGDFTAGIPAGKFQLRKRSQKVPMPTSANAIASLLVCSTA